MERLVIQEVWAVPVKTEIYCPENTDMHMHGSGYIAKVLPFDTTRIGGLDCPGTAVGAFTASFSKGQANNFSVPFAVLPHKNNSVSF